MWWIYALLSALFAALTAVFAKVGIKGVNSDVATALRTTVIFVFTWMIALYSGGTASLAQFTGRNLLFIVLSGLATGLSWLFYFKALQFGKLSQVAPIDA
jgi:transporter family protein